MRRRLPCDGLTARGGGVGARDAHPLLPFLDLEFGAIPDVSTSSISVLSLRRSMSTYPSNQVHEPVLPAAVVLRGMGFIARKIIPRGRSLPEMTTRCPALAGNDDRTNVLPGLAGPNFACFRATWRRSRPACPASRDPFAYTRFGRRGR